MYLHFDVSETNNNNDDESFMFKYSELAKSNCHTSNANDNAKYDIRITKSNMA